MTPDQAAAGVGLLCMAMLATGSFLRANLAERFGDAAPAAVLLAAWLAGTASGWGHERLRRITVTIPAVLLTVLLAAAYRYSDLSGELRTAGLSQAPREVASRYEAVRQQLADAPPVRWTDANDRSTLLAARLVSACTAPRDRVLVIGPIHEVLVYGRRGFAAGQAMFKLSLYTSTDFQRRAIAQLERERVPLALAEEAEFGEFEALYPLVADYVRRHFRPAGQIQVSEARRLVVLRAASGISPAFPKACTDFWARAVQ